jgi:hypothetical protein
MPLYVILKVDPMDLEKGKGDAAEWQKCLKAYAFSANRGVYNNQQNLIDQLPVMAKARIPYYTITRRMITLAGYWLVRICIM